MKCDTCQREFETLDSLRRHNSNVHKINSEEFYVQYILNGIRPICKCGCGEFTIFQDSGRGFTEYKRGHISRVHNNWGHNPEAIKKSHETQKVLYNTGVLKIWNKGLTIDDPRVRDNVDKVISNPERGNKISKALKGRIRTEEHKNNLSKSCAVAWDNIERRQKKSDERIKWMIDNDFIVKSKLEPLFEMILINLGLKEHIDYIQQYYVRDIKSFYDIYLLKQRVLIEVDGDFWHCNPNTIHKIPRYDAQKKNMITDAKKNKWANDNNIPLYRFWESDIKNNPEQVIARLTEIL